MKSRLTCPKSIPKRNRKIGGAGKSKTNSQTGAQEEERIEKGDTAITVTEVTPMEGTMMDISQHATSEGMEITEDVIPLRI